jgi:hypothetical protein
MSAALNTVLASSRLEIWSRANAMITTLAAGIGTSSIFERDGGHLEVFAVLLL